MTEEGALRRRDLEDVTRLCARRKVLIIVSTLLFAGVAVAYATAGSTSGQRAEVSVRIDDPVALLAIQPLILDADREAARVADTLDEFAGDRAADVSVSADAGMRAVVVSALGSTEREAVDLATMVAEAYIEARRAEFVDNLQVQADLRQRRIESLQEQIAALDVAISGQTDGDSSAMRDQRVQLVQSQLDEESELAAVEISIERGDVGLSPPVVQRTVASGGVVGTALFAVVGALLGLLLGIALALGLDALDHRLYTRRDVLAVAGSAPYVAVLGRAGPDPLEHSEVALLKRSVESSAVVVAPAGELDAFADKRLRLDVEVVGDVGDVVDGAAAIVVVRYGTTTDSELVHQLTALDVQGTAMAGILLFDVPTRELDWVRRR